MKIFALASLAVVLSLAVISTTAQEIQQFALPAEYESWTAQQKQDYIWDKKILPSKHAKLPSFKKLGPLELVEMAWKGIRKKLRFHSDVAPEGWVKYLHAVGSVAKIKFVPIQNDLNYTGVFEGSEYGFVRLSLTYAPEEKGVAPGMAVKFLIDGHPSVNFSALTALDSQGQNYNFFRYPMSNIVPRSKSVGAKIVHFIFSQVSSTPEELLVSELGQWSTAGKEFAQPEAPRQLFLVPRVAITEAVGDVRTEFAKLRVGTTLYEVRVPSKEFDYKDYKDADRDRLLKTSVHVGDLVLTSQFVASEFGDSRLYFRHQAREKPGFVDWLAVRWKALQYALRHATQMEAPQQKR